MKKTILTLIILSFFATLSKAEGIKILPADNTVGRATEVYANLLRVRMSEGVYGLNDASAILSKDNFKVSRQMMRKSESLRFNPLMASKPLYKNKNLERILATEEKLLRTFIIEYEGDTPPEQYAEYLMSEYPSVEYAEPFYVDKFMAEAPNDPLVGEQPHLDNIQIFEAWEIEEGDPDVVIGISDGGIRQEHPDLTDGIAPNTAEIPDDTIDNDSNGYVDDYIGCDLSKFNTGTSANSTFNISTTHGTEVTGIVSARVNNSIGIAGTSNKCRFFPIKIADGDALTYSYESFKYAADRGLKVLNCSWGRVKPFSPIDQSIIDYAVARDVAIVASAGNHDNSAYESNYPAAYFGVLGVGQVDESDRFVYGETTVGISCDIMAQGTDMRTTANNMSYTTVATGTSYAAPVVAGIVGLVRSRFPELDAMQSLEHVRQSIDDISDINSSDPELLKLMPGRVNALKAVSTDPFSRPGIKALDYVYRVDGNIRSKFQVDDEVNLEIPAYNYLGASEKLTFTLSIGQDYFSGAIEMIDSVVTIENIEREAPVTIQPFKFRIAKRFTQPVLLRVTIGDDNDYTDFFKFEITPTQDYVNFENKNIKLTLSEKGGFGYSKQSESTHLGVGFEYKDFGNQLFYNSGFMATESHNKAVSNYFNDMKTVQAFGEGEDPNEVIFADSIATTANKIGLEISQIIEFPAINDNTVKLSLDAKNTSLSVLTDLSVGYFLDWDIGPNEENNRTMLFEDAFNEFEIPESVAFTSQIAEYTESDYPVFGALVYSEHISDVPQAAGLDYDFMKTFSTAKQVVIMNSGTSVQDESVRDASMFIGMRFGENIQPQDSRKCYICIGAAETKEDLAAYLYDCAFTPVSVSEENSYDNSLTLFPQPASNLLNFTIDNGITGNINITITDIKGRMLLSRDDISIVDGEYTGSLNIEELPDGIYMLNIENNGRQFTRKFLKL